jgi:hypothetical protein
LSSVVLVLSAGGLVVGLFIATLPVPEVFGASGWQATESVFSSLVGFELVVCGVWSEESGGGFEEAAAVVWWGLFGKNACSCFCKTHETQEREPREQQVRCRHFQQPADRYQGRRSFPYPAFPSKN